LSTHSLQAFRALMGKQWRELLQTLTPQLEQLIEDDKLAQRVQDQRVRVGLYTWAQPMQALAAPAKPIAAKKPKKSTLEKPHDPV
jgi:hypothetical protein